MKDAARNSSSNPPKLNGPTTIATANAQVPARMRSPLPKNMGLGGVIELEILWFLHLREATDLNEVGNHESSILLLPCDSYNQRSFDQAAALHFTLRAVAYVGDRAVHPTQLATIRRGHLVKLAVAARIVGERCCEIRASLGDTLQYARCSVIQIRRSK
jgi:hypothetical protein